jgi:hypothetical protein
VPLDPTIRATPETTNEIPVTVQELAPEEANTRDKMIENFGDFKAKKNKKVIITERLNYH